MKRAPPPWVIEKLERLRRDRAKRDRSRLDLPELPSPPRIPDEREGRRSAVVIRLRPARDSAAD